jgi:hypothetical protein
MTSKLQANAIIEQIHKIFSYQSYAQIILFAKSACKSKRKRK